MRVLILNGSPHEKGCTYTALREVEKRLNENGVETDLIHVGKGMVRGCMGCGGCKKSGQCVYKDDKVNDCIALFEKADGLILGSPVHYASVCGSASSFFDRMFYASNFDKRFKLGASVVSCRRGGASAAFDRLNKYFTISSMPVVSSQYWNSVHGNTPDQVMQDLEGLQVMRALADNMAFLLKCIELGKKQYNLPSREEKISTNFIR